MPPLASGHSSSDLYPFPLFLFSHPLSKLAHVPPPISISAVRSNFCPVLSSDMEAAPEFFSDPHTPNPSARPGLYQDHISNQPLLLVPVHLAGFRLTLVNQPPGQRLYTWGTLIFFWVRYRREGDARNADRAQAHGMSAALTCYLLLSTDLPHLAPHCRLGSQIDLQDSRKLVTCPRSHSHSLQLQE